MQIDLSITQAIIEALKQNVGATGPQVDAIIGDVVNKRKAKGVYGSEYYQPNDSAVYMPVEIVVGQGKIPGSSSTYAEALGVTDQNGDYTGKWWLPYPVLSMEVIPHIVDTELTERNGVVSELINVGGYKVHITGFLVNTVANEFPEGDFDTLNRLANLGAAFTINNVKTDIAFMDSGNYNKTVTLRSLRFPKKPGVKHVQEYEMELMSEMPFNLIDIS